MEEQQLKKEDVVDALIKKIIELEGGSIRSDYFAVKMRGLVDKEVVKPIFDEPHKAITYRHSYHLVKG